MRTLFCFVFIIAFYFSGAGLVSAETIPDFSVTYEILESGSVEVLETISYDFESDDRHGIFRTIKKQHPQDATAWYKTRFIEISDVTVKRDGQVEPFTLSDSRSSVEIKVGDANETITGEHIYQISYVLSGALSYGDSGAEFYFNVTGNQWPTTIATATARVSSQVLSLNNACYQGLVGDTNDCESSVLEDGQVIFTATDLVPGEGLTIAVELESDAVAVLIHEEISINWIGYVLGFLGITILSIWAYRFRTQFKINKTVIAQYEPYEGVLPMYTGVLFDGRLDPHDITAGIIYLAEQGYIKIRKTEEKVLWLFNTTDYEFTLLQKASIIPDNFSKTLLGLIFSDGETLPQTRMLSTLKKDADSNYKLLQRLKSDISFNLQLNGFLSTVGWQRDAAGVFNSAGLTFFLLALVWLFLPSFFSAIGPVLIIVCIFAFFGLILFIVTILKPRLTTKGYEARNYLEGFKLFLSVTDKERFKFHNSPDQNPELFMEYLPYAIALKVEKEWAEVFKGITLPNPTWYQDNTGGIFTAAALVGDLGSFSSSFSASSGTSGSSGGGSSGGGGGGGGGGSW